MGGLDSHIQKRLFYTNNIFSALKLSGYLTLVDRDEKPVLFNFNGGMYIFSFNKKHTELNLGKSKKDLSFYEKLFVAGLLNAEYKWKNLVSYELKKVLSKSVAIEPRNFSVKFSDGESRYYINNNAVLEEVLY